MTNEANRYDDDLALYSPAELNEEHKARLQETMAACYPMLRSAAKANYGKFEIRRLRNEFRKGVDLQLTRQEHDALETLRAIEPTVLSGWILVSRYLCRAFYLAERRLGISMADYYQEAAVAIYNAIYSYCDSNIEFSTLAYWAIKNQLIDFIRKEWKGPVGDSNRSVIQLHCEIRMAMSTYLCDFDDAVLIIRRQPKMAEQLTDEFVEKIREAMFTTISTETEMIDVAEAGGWDYTMLAELKNSNVEADELEAMRDAIEHTDLTDFELDLIRTYLVDGHGSQSQVAARHINPNTGKPYSRGRANQLFKAACAKVQATYHRSESISDRELVAA